MLFSRCAHPITYQTFNRQVLLYLVCCTVPCMLMKLISLKSKSLYLSKAYYSTQNSILHTSFISSTVTLYKLLHTAGSTCPQLQHNHLFINFHECLVYFERSWILVMSAIKFSHYHLSIIFIKSCGPYPKSPAF